MKDDRQKNSFEYYRKAGTDLILRTIQKGDLLELWEVSYGPQADLEWMAFNGPYFQDSVLSWEEFSEKTTSKINQTNFALISFKNRIIGSLSSSWVDGKLQKWLEFGIVIYDSKMLGQGIGQKVIPSWMEELFKNYPEIQHLGFTTWSGNPGMMKLGEKCGLQLEGRIRKVRFWQEEWHDSVKYGILREEQ